MGRIRQFGIWEAELRNSAFSGCDTITSTDVTDNEIVQYVITVPDLAPGETWEIQVDRVWPERGDADPVGVVQFWSPDDFCLIAAAVASMCGVRDRAQVDDCVAAAYWIFEEQD